MLIDGKAIANEVRARTIVKLRELELKQKPALAALVTHMDAPTKQFLGIKARVGKEVGIEVRIIELPNSAKNEDLAHQIMVAGREFDGLVVQMPLSHQFSLDTVKQLMPITHDIDVIGDMAYTMFKENRLPILPPVIGAMNEIIKHHGVRLAGKKITVVGNGMLVGRPASLWFSRIGSNVTHVTSEHDDLAAKVLDADLVVLGVGSPQLLKPEMVKEGVIILDAGTSELGGTLVGDADPTCADKALLFTPTPGGIGPITVAMIFNNLVTLLAQRMRL